MAEKAGVSITKIEKHLKSLKDKGIVNRVGNHRTGHWEITEQAIEPAGLVDRLVERWVDELVESQLEIIRLMAQNPKITKKEMAEKVGVSTTTIDKNIDTLKDKKLVRRIGSDRSGHWEIIYKS